MGENQCDIAQRHMKIFFSKTLKKVFFSQNENFFPNIGENQCDIAQRHMKIFLQILKEKFCLFLEILKEKICLFLQILKGKICIFLQILNQLSSGKGGGDREGTLTII